ncbi:MAG: hypothetical protein PHQ34_01870 [Methanothrix sp.]|nr:hypothetical protein [Methanothrix sp.]
MSGLASDRAALREEEGVLGRMVDFVVVYGSGGAGMGVIDDGLVLRSGKIKLSFLMITAAWW